MRFYCSSSAVVLIVGLLVCGCGPAVPEEDLGTVLYEVPKVRPVPTAIRPEERPPEESGETAGPADPGSNPAQPTSPTKDAPDKRTDPPAEDSDLGQVSDDAAPAESTPDAAPKKAAEAPAEESPDS